MIKNLIKCQAWLPVGFYKQCLKRVDKNCWGIWCFKHCPYKEYPNDRIMCQNHKHNND